METRPFYPKKKNPAQRLHIVQEFHRSQQSMQTFVQAIPVPLSICATDGRFLAANQKFLDLLGYSHDRLVGATPEELGLWANGVGTPELVMMVREHNWVKNREFDLHTRTGRVINTLLSAERFWYQGHESMLISLVEITERRRLESQLRSRSDLLLSTGEMSRALSEVLDVPQLFERLENTVRQLMPEVTGVTVSLYDPHSQQLNRVYGIPQDPSNLPGVASIPHTGLVEPRRTGATGRLGYTGRLRQTGRLTLPAETQTLPSLVVSMVAKGEVLGIIQVQARPTHVFTESESALLSWIANTAAASIQSTRLSDQLRQTSQTLDKAFEATLESLVRALELREQENRGHTDRVILMTVELASRLGVTGKDLERVRFGAQLHDIGKVGIPDYILLKPGPLTEQEWAIMRRHPVYAYEMLSSIPQFRDILDIPYCHHERWDGTGYPRHLRGEEIPLPARIFAVVDVWDALSSDRPYRKAWPRQQVLEYIRYETGKYFDPRIAAEFLDTLS
jgi:PAS domain S-box-containing protein